MKGKNSTAIFLCIFGIIIFILGIFIYFIEIKDNENKIETVGTIINISSYNHNKNQAVLVSYNVNGKIYKSNIYISTEERRIYTGREIDIYYYKDNPTYIYKKTELSFIINFYLVGISLITLGGVIFYKDNKDEILIKIGKYRGINKKGM